VEEREGHGGWLDGLVLPAGKEAGPVGKMKEGGGHLACHPLRTAAIQLPTGVLLQRTGQRFASSDFFLPPSPEQP
jgi:hypothetical protein